MLSAGALTRGDIERLLDAADAYREGQGRRHPEAVVGLAFFEESLRTLVGFDAAAARLGARTVRIAAPKHGPDMGAPESVRDALRSIEPWFDVICMRYPDTETIGEFARQSAVPVVNCGNGRDEHPTQAIVDLSCIRSIRGAIDGSSIAMIGDLHAMRTTHSLTLALAAFDDIVLRAISPAGLGLPAQYADPFVRAGHTLDETTALDLGGVDIVYVAGLPAPTRVGTLTPSQQAEYWITADVVAHLPPDVRVLCPLPRVDEIAPEVDAMPQAAYFDQSALGLWARMAVLDEALTAPSR